MLYALLKKQDFNKLQLFNYISRHEQVEINYLAEIFKLSKTTIRRHIADLNSLLKGNGKTSYFQINQTDSSHYYLTPLTQEKFAHLSFKLQSHYLNISPQFQLLALFFSSHSLTIYQICEALIISENYCYKLIKQLKAILKTVSISINKSVENQSFSLHGSESTIRFMYIWLFLPSYQNISWPFSHLTQDSVRFAYSKADTGPLEHSTRSAKTRIEFILAIIDKRVRHNQLNEPFDETLYSIVQIFMKQHDVSKNIPHFPATFPLAVGSEKEVNEREHFNLIIRTINSSIDTQQDKLNIGEQFTLLNNPITNFYSGFIPAFFKKYNIKKSNDSLFEFMYYTVFTHSYSIYSHFNPMMMTQLNHLDSEIQIITDNTQTFKNDLDDAFSTYSMPPDLITDLTTELVSSVLVTLSQIHKEKVLYLYVQYSRDIVGGAFIQSEIHHFFSAKSIKFVSSIHDADIIISDSNELSATSEFHFFEDTTRNSSWINLFSFLQRKLYELYFLTNL